MRSKKLRPRGATDPGAAQRTLRSDHTPHCLARQVGNRHKSQPLRLPTDAGAALVASWFDFSERFLAAAWRWIGNQFLPPTTFEFRGVRVQCNLAEASLLVPAFELGRDHFPSHDHWAIAQALAVCAEHSIRPTIERVRELARIAGATLPAPDGRDLVDEIEWAESTWAGIGPFTRRLADFTRRRELRRLLLDGSDALLDPTIPTDGLRLRLIDRLGGTAA